ncbi:MAG: L,D-transpeptidase family protein [Pseudomonadota bacterium]
MHARNATALIAALLLAACGDETPMSWGSWLPEPPPPLVSLGDLPPASWGEVPGQQVAGEGPSEEIPVADLAGPPTPPETGLAPLAGGEPLPPEAWVASLAGRSPEVVIAMARLYRASGMTTLVAGTPYGLEPVSALAEWLGALTEMGLRPEEVGLDRVMQASRGACGWRMGRQDAPGPGDPMVLAAMTVSWEPPVVRFVCSADAPSTPDLDLALIGAALTAARLLGREDAAMTRLVEAWVGPEQLVTDLHGLLPRSERFWFKLQAFRRIAGPWSHGNFPVPGSWGTLKRGQHGPRVARLRRRLSAEGFLAAAEAEGRAFDRVVRDAVLAYREAYGLKHRGQVDGEMYAMLTRSPEALLADLAGSMRVSLLKGWDRHGTYVLVNVPAFRTHLYVDGRRVASYRSVVGFPYQEPGGRTPEYDAAVSYVDLNPTWTPSPYAVSHDLERKARRDPGFWRKNHFVRSGARWVQEPGPWNTLGQVVVAWPNDENIFLHGTDEPHYFDYLERALSHGCVRVEGIEDLAGRILELTGRSPDGGLAPLLRDVVERRIELRGAVPIHVIYDRIAVTDAGVVGLRPDVYGLERGAGEPAQRIAPLLTALSEARRARRLATVD